MGNGVEESRDFDLSPINHRFSSACCSNIPFFTRLMLPTNSFSRENFIYELRLCGNSNSSKESFSLRDWKRKCGWLSVIRTCLDRESFKERVQFISDVDKSKILLDK